MRDCLVLSGIKGFFQGIYGCDSMPHENSGQQLVDLFNTFAEMIVIAFECPLQVVRDLKDIHCKTLVCMLYHGFVVPGDPLPVIVEIRCEPEIPVVQILVPLLLFREFIAGFGRGGTGVSGTAALVSGTGVVSFSSIVHPIRCSSIY